jgi:Na+-translocating ferredoxin:NAD+ oxidoreductase subunit B
MLTAAQLEPLLAGTQCTQCGFPSCAAYADALANHAAPPTLCRPGGARVATALASALQLPPAPPAQAPAAPQVAWVDETRCIGCTLCLQACPTGAIVGAPKQLHTVWAADCTGCGLCLPPCPVACITLQAAPAAHMLNQQQADGSLTPAAQAATWQLVHATAARRAQAAPRAQQQLATSKVLDALPTLSPEIAAKAAAARAQAHEKYTQRTVPRLPKLLRPPKPPRRTKGPQHG